MGAIVFTGDTDEVNRVEIALISNENEGEFLLDASAYFDSFIAIQRMSTRVEYTLSEPYRKVESGDATLGYDRLYDTTTGEIYRAELGFYDNYNLNRDSFSNPNLRKIDSSSESYYLSGLDYYIGRWFSNLNA